MSAKRTRDADAIERRLLELAYTTETKLTAPSLAYYAGCSIEDAAQVLEDLAARDRVRMEVESDGTVVYEIPGRQKLAGARAPSPPPAPVPTPWLAPRPAQVHHGMSPLLAALLTVFMPGAGHLYAGRIFAAVMWFFVVGAGYALILPGLVLHMVSIFSAASAARQVADRRSPPLLAAAAF